MILDAVRTDPPDAVLVSSAGPVISVSQVGFVYPGATRPVLSDVSFEVGRGEIVAVVGPSGCGKSTLLRLLAGLSPPSTGSVQRSFGDSRRHGCSMVFQEDTLLPWLRVKDNVGLYYRLKHKRGPTVKRDVEELLGMVGLSMFGDYYPYQLSGGMKRRVAMLAAVAPRPALLLLDEPFSALDEPTRVGLHSDVHSLIRELEISAVLVTHDLAEALTLSDRVIMFSSSPGRIVSVSDVRFGRRRDMMELRASPEFLMMYGHLWELLCAQIAPREEST